MSEALSLEVRDLVKHFPVRGGFLKRGKTVVRAVDGVSFAVRRGETLGIVGESGCGKSTLGRVAMKLLEPTAGRVLIGGADVTRLAPGAMWEHRRRIQLVFQDPYSSLNPRLSAGTIVGEPLENFGLARGAEKDECVAQLFRRVGLRPEAMRRYPHEFSGGQRQRLGIAKALAVKPDVIVADEPVSALDVSVQAQVLNLLIDLQEEYRLSYLFISHDLAVMRHVSHRIAVMYLGRIVELADKRTLFSRPLHPYTEALLAAAPIPDPTKRKIRRRIVQGEVPSPMRPPSGCRFHPRCPYALPACRTVDPPLIEVVPGHLVACIRRPPGAAPLPLTPTH
ncbi:MAG TPA: dipeptide ABC transporter ATP-binding protein [Beijerinckiaceae bacterium]|jgi:peptide/nickel transport system ATP-binding protein/oligopeptide transport system ATP-binding protein